MLARRHRRTEEKRWSSCPRGAGSRGGSGIVLRAMFRILRCQGWKEFNMVLSHRIISEGERRTAVPYYIICSLLSVAGQSCSEGEGEGGGRFHIEPVSRFWKGGRASQQLSASRRGVWRSLYVDMRDSRGAIIYLVFSCSYYSSDIFQASKSLCSYPSSPIHVFPFLLFPFLTGDRLSHKCE